MSLPSQPSQPSQQAAPQDTGRSRLARALVRPSRGQAVVGVLLALVGFAGVTQIRTAGDDSTYSGLREQDLIDVLNGLAGTTQRTQAEIDRLTREREDLLSESTQRQAALDRTRREVANLNVLAGLVPVTGPGVRVTISDGTGVVRVSSFLDVIQELRSVGAEAIQVNGEVRLIAQSSFEQGTGGLIIDGTLVEPPYVVDAIGESTVLSGAMEFPLGVRKTIEDEGGELEVEELGSIDIATTRSPTQSEFAQPDP